MTDMNINDFLADAPKEQPTGKVSITPPAIPPHIANNLLEFLRRVKSEGMEAIAWVEAYSFVQRLAPQPQPVAAPPVQKAPA